MNDVILSTGDIRGDYEVVDIIHVGFSIRGWWVRTGGRETMDFMPEVHNRLKQAGKEKGCDAVIWIDFEVSRETASGVMGAKTTTVIMAHGTGVKFK